MRQNKDRTRHSQVSELTGLRHIGFQSAVLAVFRLRETRDHLLIGWLFTERQLRDLGFLPVEEFVGGDQSGERWKSLDIKSWGMHLLANQRKRNPAELFPPPLWEKQCGRRDCQTGKLLRIESGQT